MLISKPEFTSQDEQRMTKRVLSKEKDQQRKKKKTWKLNVQKLKTKTLYVFLLFPHFQTEDKSTKETEKFILIPKSHLKKRHATTQKNI